MEKQWNVKGKFSGDLVSDLLKIRELDKELFLNPKHPSEITDNLKLDFDKAVELIQSHIKKGSPITIHGDYDVDGICATAILWKTVYYDLGYKNCLPFIPDRFADGYGLSIGSVEKIKEKSGGGLIITVDCGITAKDSVAHAKKLGFDVIITDHHQKPEDLPEADCILWTDELVGSGISLLLSSHLNGFKDEYLALAALATVTDISPLVSHNRSIVKFGLEELNANIPLSIKSLLNVAGAKSNKIGTYELGWIIGPRLNASGRLESAMDSLRLLCTKNEEEALKLSLNLNVKNKERQDKTFEMFEKARTGDFGSSKIIAIADKTYHEGVIGLVAGRLTQEFYKPSVVISLGDEISKGSARSVEGVDVISLLRKLDVYEELGGHKMAAGFSIKTSKVEKFIRELTKLSDKEIDEESLKRGLNIDLELPPSEINLSSLENLKDFEPFGFGNQEPIFVTRNLRVVDSKTVGSLANHVKFTVQDPDSKNTFNAIYFGGAEKFKSTDSEVPDLAFSLRENNFGYSKSLELQIKDISTP